MSFDPTFDHHLRDLEQQLCDAHTITPVLMRDLIAQACPRFRAQNPAAKAKVLQLVDSGAFADATLALVALELPPWRLRRLIHDEGEWHCAFSKELGVPIELDEMAEATHAVLPLAMLGALLEACRHGLPAAVPFSTAAAREPAAGHAICCDNFA